MPHLHSDSYSGQDEVDDLIDKPELKIANIFAFGTGIIFCLMAYGTSYFELFFFYELMNVCGLYVVMETNWDEHAEPGEIVKWWAIGTAAVLIVGLAWSLSLTAISDKLIFQSAVYVPAHVIASAVNNPSQPDILGLKAAFLDIFGTSTGILIFDLMSNVFMVCPGEQSWQAFWFSLHHIYYSEALDDARLFFLQPFNLFAIGIWAVSHVVDNQYPMFYWIPVGISGAIMMQCAFMSGNWYTSTLIHTVNNLVALLGGALLGAVVPGLTILTIGHRLLVGLVGLNPYAWLFSFILIVFPLFRLSLMASHLSAIIRVQLLGKRGI